VKELRHQRLIRPWGREKKTLDPKISALSSRVPRTNERWKGGTPRRGHRTPHQKKDRGGTIFLGEVRRGRDRSESRLGNLGSISDLSEKKRHKKRCRKLESLHLRRKRTGKGFEAGRGDNHNILPDTKNKLVPSVLSPESPGGNPVLQKKGKGSGLGRHVEYLARRKGEKKNKLQKRKERAGKRNQMGFSATNHVLRASWHEKKGKSEDRRGTVGVWGGQKGGASARKYRD